MSTSPTGPKSAAALAAQEAARRAAEAARRAAEAARAAQARAQAAQAAQARAQATASRGTPSKAAAQFRNAAQDHTAQLVERIRSAAQPVNLQGGSQPTTPQHAGGLSPSALEALLHGNKTPTYDVSGANQHMSRFRYAEEGAGTELVDSIVAMELNGGRADFGKDNALNCVQASAEAQDYFNEQQPPVETEIVVADDHSVLRMPDGRYYDPSRAMTGQDPFLTPEQAGPFEGVDGVSVEDRQRMATAAREAVKALPPGASAQERQRVGEAAASAEARAPGTDGQTGEVSALRTANGLLDDITEPFEDVADVVGDAFGDLKDGLVGLGESGLDVVGEVSDAVLDEGGKLVSGTLELAGDSAHYIADAGARTIDFTGEVIGDTFGAVSDAIQFAASQGLQLTGELAAQAREIARSTILGPLDIGGNVDQLGVGDSYTFGIGGEVSGGVTVGAAGEVEVKRTQDPAGADVYTVSAELNVDIGLSIPGGEATVGANGKVEWQFDNPEDAKRAAEIVALAGAGVLMSGTPGLQPLGGAMMPSQDDMAFLTSNMSAVEISGEAGIGLAADLGVGDAIGASASASTGVSVRVELEDGQPTAVEIKSKAEVKLSADASLDLLGDAGVEGFSMTGGEVEATAELERTVRIPVKAGTTVEGLLTDPLASTDRANSTVTTKATVELSGEVNGQTGGVKVEVDVSAIPPGDFDQLLLQAASGNPTGLIDVLRTSPRTTERYTERGIDADPELKIAGQGFQVHVKSEIKDVQ